MQQRAEHTPMLEPQPVHPLLVKHASLGAQSACEVHGVKSLQH
jgi:hypothetical protein